MSESEVYRLDCFACTHTVQLSSREGEQACPNCGALLTLEWRGAHADLDQAHSDGKESAAAS